MGRLRTESEQGAARRHRPQALDGCALAAEAAHAYVPIVQVDGGGAVAGDEQDLLTSDWTALAWGHIEDAVLVRGPKVGGAGPLPRLGHAAVNGEGLVAGIDHGPLGHGGTHHSGVDEQRVLEGVEGPPVGALVAGIV